MAKMRKGGSRKRPSMGRFLGDIRREIDDCVGRRPECIVEVLDYASESAFETARHVEENWQDRATARAWDKIGRIINRASAKVKRELPF